jgi:ABC-type nickel/cobalt efflux system permease component RcnA
LVPILALTAVVAGTDCVCAHPAPSLAYDHTVLVQLTPKGIEIRYLLDVESVTVQFDLRHLLTKSEYAALRSEADVHAAFQKTIGPMLAERLVAFQGDTPLVLVSGEGKVEILDHLRFTFAFRAKWAKDPLGEPRFRLEVQRPLSRGDSYFEQEKGRLDVSFSPNPFVVLRDRDEPPAALKLRPLPELTDAEKDRAGRLAARIEPTALGPLCGTVGGPAFAVGCECGMAADQPAPAAPAGSHWRLADLLESRWGFGLSLLMAIVFGAAHALTPGHGKTLVAAYLVGQRGTVGHAVLLGTVTTITHTGIVILIAAMLPLLATRIDPTRMQEILGFAVGLLIAGMGIWLVLRRLAGQADHVHVGSGHHHHHDGHGHHHHHLPADAKVRFWDLVLLGISGGIVPCWDAIVLLGLAIATHRLWAGLPLLLAFSAGLAGVLVLIGVLVVKLKGFGGSRWGSGRLTRALPLVSAAIITVIGIWLCVDSISTR